MARIAKNLRVTAETKVLAATDPRHESVRHAQLEALRGLLRAQTKREKT